LCNTDKKYSVLFDLDLFSLSLPVPSYFHVSADLTPSRHSMEAYGNEGVAAQPPFDWSVASEEVLEWRKSWDPSRSRPEGPIDPSTHLPPSPSPSPRAAAADAAASNRAPEAPLDRGLLPATESEYYFAALFLWTTAENIEIAPELEDARWRMAWSFTAKAVVDGINRAINETPMDIQRVRQSTLKYYAFNHQICWHDQIKRERVGSSNSSLAQHCLSSPTHVLS
jgi:hypothetical protein